MAARSRRGMPQIGRGQRGAGRRVAEPDLGTGICGADFPLKVAVLGEGSPLGYADEVRPPGLVPQSPSYQAAPNYQRTPTYQPTPAYSPARATPAYAPPNEPIDTRRPAAAIAPLDDPYRYRGPQGAPAAAGSPMPLGPARAPVAAATVAAVAPPATLACPIVSALDRWVRMRSNPRRSVGSEARSSRSNRFRPIPAAA